MEAEEEREGVEEEAVSDVFSSIDSSLFFLSSYDTEKSASSSSFSSSSSPSLSASSSPSLPFLFL